MPAQVEEAGAKKSTKERALDDGAHDEQTSTMINTNDQKHHQQHQRQHRRQPQVQLQVGADTRGP